MHKLITMRYRVDLIPTLILFTAAAILLYTWFYSKDYGVWLTVNILLFLPRFMSSTFVHNHSHLPTFKSKFGNFILDTVLYFLSGMMTSKFKLHHNLGHHLHYLDPEKDPSKWMHKDGKPMSRIYYSLRYFLTHTYFSVKIGLDHPKLLKEYLIQQVWVLMLFCILFAVRPEATLYLFLIPMTLYWLIFISVTYDDHVGLDSQEPLEASFSKKTGWINRIILNNGYHMAHHLKPGLHWSKLPEYHEKLEPKLKPIPAHTVLNKFSEFLERKAHH